MLPAQPLVPFPAPQKDVAERMFFPTGRVEVCVAVKPRWGI